jgi:phage terminase small subunit
MPGNQNSGRIPKPLAIHVLEGTYRAHRHGPQNRFESIKGEPEHPPWLKNEDDLAIWDHVTAALAEIGILAKTDGLPISRYCVWMRNWMHYAKAVPIDLRALGECEKHLRGFEDRFGLSPSARMRVRVAVEEKRPGLPTRDRSA